MTISNGNIQAKKKQKPDLPRELFWNWRYHEIDWQRTYRSIIERVLEVGTMEEWEELIRFYGKPRIVKALKKEIKYLPDHSMRKRQWIL